MIAFSVVVRHEVADRVLKRGLSEEDHSVQALALCGAHEAFGDRGGSRMRWMPSRTRALRNSSEYFASRSRIRYRVSRRTPSSASVTLHAIVYGVLAPAVALCAAGTPTHDCCPNRSQGAGSCSHEITPHSGIQSCCAAGAQTVAVSALNVTPSKTDIRPTRADPPLSIIFLAALGAGYPSPRSGVASSTPSFFPALSPLYLRTSRPRL